MTSPSATKKSLDSNRVFSPLESNLRNSMKNKVNNYKYKEQAMSPNNLNKTNISYEQTKQLKKTLLGKYKINEDSENNEKNSKNNNINLDNSIRSDATPVGKQALNEKIRNFEKKEREKENYIRMRLKYLD